MSDIPLLARIAGEIGEELLRDARGRFLPRLDWQPVSSTNVKEVAYVADVSELHVLLNGGYYIYEGVPYGVLEDLVNAASPGSYLNTNIKPVYAFRKA